RLLGVEDEGALFGSEGAPEDGLFLRVGDGFETDDEFVGLRVAAGGHGKRLRAGGTVAFGSDALGALGFALEFLDLAGERRELFLRLHEFLGGARAGSERL